MKLLSKPRVWLFPAAVMLLVISCRLFGGEDSPAPGCKQGLGGGCWGRTVIEDFEVRPEIECLRIKPNNCNGGVIDAYNGCETVLVLGDHEIQPGDYPTFDLVETGDGGYKLIEIYSNFSEYLPETEKHITITGAFEGQALTITFTKTEPLCEESE